MTAFNLGDVLRATDPHVVTPSGVTLPIRQDRLEPALSDALVAFWRSVVADFPEATRGDLTPEADHRLMTAARAALREWVELNVDFDPEAERDTWRTGYHNAEAATRRTEARLAAVEALCEHVLNGPHPDLPRAQGERYVAAVVHAAARGEDHR